MHLNLQKLHTADSGILHLGLAKINAPVGSQEVMPGVMPLLKDSPLKTIA